MKYAKNDKPHTLEGHGSGVYMCYCKETYSLKDAALLFLKDGFFCKNYFKDHVDILAIEQSTSFMIILIN